MPGSIVPRMEYPGADVKDVLSLAEVNSLLEGLVPPFLLVALAPTELALDRVELGRRPVQTPTVANQ